MRSYRTDDADMKSTRTGPDAGGGKPATYRGNMVTVVALNITQVRLSKADLRELNNVRPCRNRVKKR